MGLIQHLLMIKSYQPLSIEGGFLNLIESMYLKKSIENIIINNNIKQFLPVFVNKTRMVNMCQQCMEV